MKRRAQAYAKGLLPVSWLAEQEGIPQRFLEPIWLDLRKQGLGQSQQGKGGGYELGLEPEAVNRAPVVRRLEGPIAPPPGVSTPFSGRWDDCGAQQRCPLGLLMVGVRAATLAVYEKVSLQELARTAQT